MIDHSNSPEPGASALTDALDTALRALRWAMACAVLVAAVRSCVYVVRQDEVALVLRLGRLDGAGAGRERAPGLHMSWPYPVDQIIRVPVRRVRTAVSRTFWTAQTEAGELEQAEAAAPDSLRPGAHGYSLSGDANILHSKWAVRFTARDPARALLGFRNVENMLLNELDRVVTLACAQYRVDDILRSDEAFRDLVGSLLKGRCETLDLGLAIERVDLLELSPPLRVKNAFDAVLRAEMSRGEAVNGARAWAAAAVNEAGGLAARLVSGADTYRIRLLSSVSADAATFEKLLPQYTASPVTLRQTLLQDALRRVLSQVEAKYVIREAPGGRQELRLQLAPELKGPASRSKGAGALED